MVYVVTKYINGNPYLYEVKSVREGDRVRQVFVRYLGRADQPSREYSETEPVERRERIKRPAVAAVSEAVAPTEVKPPVTPEVTIPKGIRPDLYVADIEGMMPETANKVKTVQLPDGNELVIMSDEGDIYGLIDGKEVGFATKLSDTETDLSVTMEHRNKGIGTELMRQFQIENPGHPTGGLTEGGKRVIEKLAEIQPITSTEAVAPAVEVEAETPAPMKPIPPAEEVTTLQSEKAVQDLVNELRTLRQQRLDDKISQREFLEKQRDISRKIIEVEPLDSAKETWRGILSRTETELATITPEVTKEPWQMTKAEYAEAQIQKSRTLIETWNKAGSKGIPPTAAPSIYEIAPLAEKAGYIMPRDAEKVLKIPYHQLQVEASLNQGLPVPPEVLRDYPELTPTSTPEVMVTPIEPEITPIPKTERETALSSTYDAFKVHNAPTYDYVDKYGNDRIGWSSEAYTSDYMTKSSDTGRNLRWVYVLSDGREVSLDSYLKIKHPEMAGQVSSGKSGFLKVWNKLDNEEKQTIVEGLPWDDILPKGKFSPTHSRDALNSVEQWLIDNKHPLAPIVANDAHINYKIEGILKWQPTAPKIEAKPETYTTILPSGLEVITPEDTARQIVAVRKATEEEGKEESLQYWRDKLEKQTATIARWREQLKSKGKSEELINRVIPVGSEIPKDMPDDIRKQLVVAIPKSEATPIPLEITIYHAKTKGEFPSGKPSTDIGSDADILGKGFYFGTKEYASRYGTPEAYTISGKFATQEQWVEALSKYGDKPIKEQRALAREALKSEGYVGIQTKEVGVVWDDKAIQATPRAKVTPIPPEVATVDEIKATHVTSNPQPVIDALKSSKNLGETRGEGLVGDLGASGLYVSNNPQMWIGRATSKWHFLKELTPDQKDKLIGKVIQSVDEQMKYGGIADFEYQNLMRDINYVKEGKLDAEVLVSAANQPFNIAFWKPEYLSNIGIEQTNLPIEVPVTARGKFADVTKVKGGMTQGLIDSLKALGYDGMIHRGSWGTPEQTVIWNPKAIESFGEYTQPSPTKEVTEPEVAKKEGSLIAKYTETKMSPETGLDTEYSTEYRLIGAPENAGAEWMGNEYGIIRVYNKGGIEISRDLLEVGMSEDAVVKALPWETSYKKAEKFGLAKTEYEKYEKELADKEQTKIAEAQAEKAGYERYQDAIANLGSIKGIRKTDITYFSPIDNEQKTREGFDVGNGVGIVVHEMGRGKEYAVTHINTGLAMGHNWKNRAEAIALAKSVAKITDWSQFSNEKEIPQEIMTQAAGLVRGFTQKNLQPLPIEVTQPEIPKTEEPEKQGAETTPSIQEIQYSRDLDIRNIEA